MKYRLKNIVEKLKDLEKEYPAITVDWNHPSLVLFERISCDGQQSVIDLSKSPGFLSGPVYDLVNRLSDLSDWTDAVDEFGDEVSIRDLRSIVRRSWAKVQTGEFAMSTPFTRVVGPISKITSTVPPESPEPAPPVQSSPSTTDTDPL